MAKKAMMAKYERFVEMEPYFYTILRHLHAREFYFLADMREHDLDEDDRHYIEDILLNGDDDQMRV